MTLIDTAVKFFQDSGLAIYPSILIMAIGLAIAVERFVFLKRAGAENRKLWSQMLPLLQSGRLKDVQHAASSSDAAVGKIVANGLQRMQSPGRREDVDAAMEEGMMEIVPRLEKRTHYIATFANVITLVGLLGTIIGLIKGFTAVSQVNPAEKAELLSASISIAMNNTAFALTVAIPFLLIHAFLHCRIVVFAAPRALHAGEAVIDDLADRRVGVCGHALHLLELAVLQHRQHLRPDLAVLRTRAVEKDQPLDGDGHTQRHDEDAGVDEQAAILEELHCGTECIHRLFLL